MSDHHAPIPPPVSKPHPDARMMQTLAGEWLWAVPCSEAQGAPPAGTPTVDELREALDDAKHAMADVRTWLDLPDQAEAWRRLNLEIAAAERVLHRCPPAPRREGRPAEKE